MASVRPAAVAGSFYPRDARALAAELEDLLGGVEELAPRLGFPKALVVPHAVGTASVEEVAQVLERLWGGPETLIVISTDMSHYHTYEDARRVDGATLARIATYATDLDHEEACGATPLNGLLYFAKKKS